MFSLMNAASTIPPLIPPPVPRDRLERFLRWVAALVLVGLLLFAALVYAATGYLRLSSEMSGLRDSVQTASGQSWRRTIALNIGGFTFGAARAGLHFVEMEEEPRLAVQTLRSCEVGIYETSEDTESADRGAMLAAADQAMQQRGWERIVGVIDDRNLAAVYVPANFHSPRDLKCCVVVFEGHKMILVSSRANLEPAIAFALRHADIGALHKPHASLTTAPQD
jgi:hypothetical protein